MSLSVAKRKGLTRERLIQIGADAGLDEEEVRAAIEAATMQARIGAVDKLANVLAKLVPLERKTYGLDEDGAENEWETKWRLLAEQYDTELAQSTQAS
jgi:DNA-binding transcriptional regulator PaaX